MGRRYSTGTGREGKFLFGVQPSDDPEYMGMEEDNGYTYYYACEEDRPEIKENLDEQYDFLGIEKKNRWYNLPENDKDDEKWDKWEKEVLEPKVWKKVKNEDLNGAIGWYCEEKGYSYLPIKEGAELALARIRLGLVILTDILETGECSLRAEN